MSANSDFWRNSFSPEHCCKIQEEILMPPEAATRPPCQERNLDREHWNPLLSCSRKFSKVAQQKFPFFCLAHPKPQKAAHLSKIHEIYATELILFFVFEFVVETFKMFHFRFFFFVSCPQWPFPNQQFLCGFQKLQSHSSWCRILGRTNFVKTLGWQTLTLTEWCPG